MESENEQNLKVGAGIITISILHFIGAFFTFIGYVFMYAYKDKIMNILAQSGQSTAMPSTSSIAINLILEIILVVGLILILNKKNLGAYLYFLSEIVFIIYYIIASGFSLSLLLYFILPIIMAIFIYKKKNVFWHNSKSNA